MLTSFGLFLSLFTLLASGVILYLFPAGTTSGRVSEFAGLTKPAWLGQHIIFGYAFALLSLFHLFSINREAFFSYLKKRSTERGLRHKELLVTILLTSFIAIGTHARIQPFSGILGIGKQTSGSREGIEFPEPATTADHARHHRHHFESDGESREALPFIASRQAEPEEPDATAQDSGRGWSGGDMMSSQAPDDELHRNTKASCASCH